MDEVLFEMIGAHIARVTLNRPEKRNAVNGALAQGLSRIVERVEQEPEIRVAILASSHPTSFCAGADMAAAAGEGDLMHDPVGGFAGFTDRDRMKPWIAAVDGFALAGGFELVLACDMVVAGAGASFGLPETKRSLIAGAGGTYRLPRLIPRNIALEMIATGEPIDAARAEALGLVNRLVPAGGALAAAQAVAEQVAANAPLAVQHSLAIARGALNGPESAGRARALAAYDAIGGSLDMQEGPRAFLEKRAPVWQGR